MIGRALRAAVLFVSVLGLNSCVPLLVGAAVGYVARGEGFGVAPPLNSGGDESHQAPAYDEGGDSYDMPVY